MVMSFRGLWSIQGRRDPSFFPTKKNPAPAGEDEGCIKAASNEVVMRSFMAFFSGPEMEYRWPLGIVDPGSWSLWQGW